MPGMKVTVDAAMRARDVSRPHAEHDALAAASEPRPARARDKNEGPLREDSAAGAPGSASPAAVGAPPKGRSPRRRRRRR